MSNSTSADYGIGFSSCLVASLFFGSNFAVIKGYDIGDGLFVQWVMSSAIFCVGLIVNAVQGFPKFHPLAMLGGFLWATGNLAVVPIIRCIGMALGILVWSSTNMLFGWASGRYGWFGIHPEPPESDLLNYLGLAISVIGSIIFFFVGEKGSVTEPESSTQRLLDGTPEVDEDDIVDTIQPDPVPDIGMNGGFAGRVLVLRSRAMTYKRLIGFSLSLVAGIFFGLCFAPIIYIQDTVPGASQKGLDYVFAQYCGISLCCTGYFVVYALVLRSKPIVRRELFIPSFICGLMWAVAQTCWFVANEYLSEAISFPIITRLPGVIASLWGVLYFKEISGRKNLLILLLAIFVTLIGSVLVGLSKTVET